ncbi:MAG: ATP-binding cassette domain-containing protein [Rhodothermales bacterium]|nr:ATP-binding cassette domain-containing protein [Rhodothermales bacterium]
MIEVNALVKRYGDERAVDDISFEVPAGQILGFLGPNGAGKTTTMKVITCYLPPSEGTVRVDGLDVRTDSLEIRNRIGYLPEHTPLYHEMVVVDYLKFVADMRGLSETDARRRIARMAEVCGIRNVLSKRIEALSKGYRQRVGLAQALIHDPPILILDEPTTGLDPNQIVEIRELIKDIGREKTVLLSTHILPEVQASCDRVLIIHRGKLVADGTPDDLQAGHTGAQRVRFAAQTSVDDVRSALSEWHDISLVAANQTNGEAVVTLATERTDDLRPELFRLAVDRGWVMTELVREQANLEDVFRSLTSA